MANTNPGPWNQYGTPTAEGSDGPWKRYPSASVEPPKRSVAAAINDTVIEVANAAAGFVSSTANFVKPGNDVSKWIDMNIVKAGEDKQSDVVKAEKQRLSADLAAAEGAGDEVAAVGRYIVNNPVLSAAQAAGSFVGPGLAVKGATTAARVAGGGAKAMERAGRTGGVAAGAAMAGGDAAGTAYELATKAGATEDQAVAAGRQASVLPAIVGGAGGAFGAEKLLAGAKGFTGGTVTRALKTGASEALQEGIEEGVTQYEGQRAAVPYDPSIDPSKGVAGAAAMGAALGGITGAGMGALDGLRHGPQQGTDPLSQAVAGQQAAEAAAADAQAKADPPAWTTAPGAVDPNTPTVTGAAVDANAPRVAEADFETQPGAAPARENTVEFTRDFETGNLALADEQQTPSQRAGIDPRAGSLSAGAALALDTGVSQQLQSAADTLAAIETDAALATAQQEREREASKQAKKQPAADGIDPDTGEIATGLSAWSDVQLSNAFRSAQDKGVRAQLARELERRRTKREKQALQAELDAEQAGTVPGAERADAAFASLSEDAGPVPADLSTPTIEGTTNGPEATQAQQARTEPPQVGAAPAVARPAPDAQGSGGPRGARAAGVADGSTAATNPGAQAAPAPGAQAQGGETEPLRQQLRDVEAKILQTAPAAMGQGGGDIEAAMKSRKVPITLKAQRKKLVDQIQAAQAEQVQTFAPETGTLGIPRADMPQVPAQSHGGLVKHLNAQGIAHETTTVNAADLRPTQAEYSPSKVEAAKTATGDRAVIVSSDGHVIDGHHQALAAAEEGKPVKAIVLDAPVEQALEAVKNSPSAQSDWDNQPVALDAKAPEAIKNVAKAKAGESVARPRRDALTPAAPKKAAPRGILAKKAEAEAKARADYFTPGNVVRSYSGFDVVLAYHPATGEQRWSVDVREVTQNGDGKFEFAPGSQPRTHATEPTAQELRVGPRVRMTLPEAQKQAEDPEENPPAALESVAPDASNTVADPPAPTTDRITDFGEKIGGARKDKAGPAAKASRPRRADERPAWARRFEISQIAKSSRLGEEGRWVVRDTRRLDAFKQPRQMGRETYATKEDAEQAVPLLAVSQKHRVVPVRGDGAGYEIWRDVSDRKRVKVVDQVFPTREAALEYMVGNAQAIIETNTTFGEADLPRPPSDQRLGAERRTSDARDSDFTEVFGFRGVEFGNWNNQQERQELLNDAYDGLLDLAEVMDVPPRAISLNGELALAFGARGHGLSGARAHYELDKVVINLTKMNGAGSLAHEWFHALDHYFGRQDGKAPAEWMVAKDGTRSLQVHDAPEDDMASGGTRGDRSGMRPELREAYADVMRTISRKAEAYVEDAARADKFVATARQDVKQRLDGIRADLARDLDARYYKRHNKAATAEQLAEFDSVAEKIVAGELLELRVESKGSGRSITSGIRWTNDALNRISAVMKAVRGRQGFSAEQDGPLDRLRGLMQNYSARLKMLADAQATSEKSRMVPTEFVMNAKELDQGRGQDYWTRPHELAARAFQGYVEDKIAERGGRSPFLNYGPENVGIPTPWGFKRPFPAGAERAAINRSLDKLVEVIQTREGEDGGVALFRREATENEAGFDADALRKVLQRSAAYSEAAQRQAVDAVSVTVEAIRAAWGQNAPDVVVAFDMQDSRVPEAARKADLRQRSGGARGAPEGFYYRGKAYLMASRLNTPNDAARVLFHEVLGHHGLRGKFGRDLDLVLNQVATMRKAEVAAKIQEYGLRGVRELSVREAAEEVLAEMAEKNPKLHFVQRAVAAIRNFLRTHVPGFRNLRMTDNDIIQAYILPARGWVERGGVDLAEGAAPELVVNFARHPGFSAAVDAAVKAGTVGESGGRAHVEIGTLPPALAAAGVPAGDLKTSAKVLQKVVFDHGVPPSVLKRIPELLERPVMVFRSATVDGSFVAVTSEMVRGAPLIVAISPETTRGAVALNFVPSLYPRDDLQAIQRWLNATKPGDQLLTYLDKEQSPAWFGSTRLQLPGEYRTAQGLQSRSVKTQADVVNVTGSEGDEPVFSRSKLQEMKASALDQIQQALSHPGKVSLWDKSVGTMRHLAERAPAFKPVFESAQRFIDDVALLANDAADFAPRLLPRVDSWRDLTKKPISAEDNKALARPLFEGTLMWGRDVDGKPVPVDDLTAKYASLSADAKAQLMLAAGRIEPSVLQMWRGLPLPQFEASVNSRFEGKVLKAGVVWTTDELKGMFGLTDHQVSLYQEARAAIDRSIDVTTRADMLRALGDQYAPMRDAVLEQATLADAMEMLTRTLQDDARGDPDQADRLMALNNQVVDRYERAKELMAEGYAPLSRFGRYTVDVVDASGERQYFGMFETMREANQMRMRMASAFPGAIVTSGTMSQEAYKLFQGITPESLEMFGNMLGLSAEGSDAQDKAFQEYLKLAKNNHSSLKRLIHRKGIAGYSEDVGRVLASFVYSNARQGAGALNAGTMETAINNIPKEQGELRDVAVGLQGYIRDPQEEGQAVRGMLFAQYLGGSLASAFVNTTQPFTVTLPWLSQFGGMRAAGTQMGRALKDMGTKGFRYEADLAAALHHAEDDGVVSPQEIHQLMAQARGAGTLRTGDGTRLGDARATAANHWERAKVAWGQPFALAEQFNRRSTFIAAYRLAKEKGMDRPAEFARRAVLETQFLYSKANKPKWGRGAVGGTLMTFKTYSISYLELMQRTWNAGEPGSPERAAGRRAVGWAVAMLMLMGGAGGLPFMEDLEDLIDGVGQLMGYNLSTKQWRKQVLRDALGKELATFMEQGVSGLPGAPIDVSGRLGMGNLIPGTGLFLTKPNRERDLLEVAGPAGDLVARGFGAARKALTGDMGGAALEVAPTAVRNAAKGIDMATSGIYKDTKGYKVIDTTLDEAIAKAIGFQPRSVAEVQESNSFMQRSKSFYVQTSSDIKAQWAQALFEKDEAALGRVRERLADWNRDNPEQPIVVKMPDVWKRVREMGKDRSQRIADTAPKALRLQMRDLAKEQS